MFFRFTVSVKTLFFWLIITSIQSFELQAQYFTPIGARLNSIANSSVAISDAFSVFSNPSNLAFMDKTSIAVYADHRYAVSGLNTLAFAYNQLVRKVNVSVGAARFGDELLNHNRVEAAAAYKVRLVSLGVGLGYQQLTVSENGVGRAMTLQFGGTVEISPKIRYAAHVYNMLRAKVDARSSLYYPVIMRTGFSYLPVKSAIFSAEIEKDSRFEPNIKLGLEYQLKEWIYLRTGINSNPFNTFGGIGFKQKEWKLDYGVSFHNRLGMVHYLSLVFSFDRKLKEKTETQD
jgi:hypothetical protein